MFGDYNCNGLRNYLQFEAVCQTAGTHARFIRLKRKVGLKCEQLSSTDVANCNSMAVSFNDISGVDDIFVDILKNGCFDMERSTVDYYQEVTGEIMRMNEMEE